MCSDVSKEKRKRVPLLNKKVTRRKAISTGAKVAAAGVLGLAVGGAIGYFVKPPEVIEKVRTETVTKTVTSTATVTTTVTGMPATTTTTTPATPAAPFIPTRYLVSEEEIVKSMKEANINWRAYEGEEVYVFTLSFPWVDAIKPLIPIFERETGIKVTWDAVAEMEWGDKVNTAFAAGAIPYTSISLGPIYTWQWAGPGWLEPLDDYIHNDKLTDPNWFRYDDFIPATTFVSRWDRETKHEGKGPTYFIPGSSLTNLSFYRKDMFDKYGFNPKKFFDYWPDVPDNVAELRKALERDGLLGKMYPITLRGIRIFITTEVLTTIMQGWGLKFFDEDWKPLFLEPDWIEAMDIYLRTFKEGGQPVSRIFQTSFYDVAQDIQAGIALSTIDISLDGPLFDNPATSKTAGKVGCYLVPAGPKGRGSRIWVWGLGMPKNIPQRKKEATWLFIEWATSPVVTKAITLCPAMSFDPCRFSTWEDERFKDLVKGLLLGEWYPYTLEMYSKYTDGSVYPTIPELLSIMDIMSGPMQDVIAGKLTTKEAMKQIYDAVYDLMKTAGYYR